ncbi:MAG: ABC transporter permease, partial [Vicinamibacterales bacterium]
MTVRAWSIAAATLVYSTALLCYPRALRARYAGEMRATFAERCHDAATAGAVLRLLAVELADLAAASIAARRHPSTVDHLPSATGHPPLAKRHDERRSNPVSALSQDIRYAVRMLRRQPGFAIVAVLTLALGIGANTAVFTVVNGVLLRPLPYREPGRLVQLFHGRNGRLSMTYSPPNFLDVTAQSGVFSGATAMTPSSANLTGVGDPLLVNGANVSPSFFTVIGVVPRLGRGLVDGDGENGGAAVVVIGDGFWRRQFGARPDVIGSTLRMDGQPFTIVGVAPPDLNMPRGAEFWRPLIFKPRDVSAAARGAQWIGGIARLKP